MSIIVNDQAATTYDDFAIFPAWDDEKNEHVWLLKSGETEKVLTMEEGKHIMLERAMFGVQGKRGVVSWQ